jgi:hypothetical protein
MEVPKPVNLSALSGILAKSKQVMNQIESKKPVKQTGNMMAEDYGGNNHAQSYGYNENDEKEMVFENYTPSPSLNQNVGDYTDEQVMNSNFPPAIKEAMIKHRIPKLSTPPARFTAEDISKMTGAPIRQPNQPVRQPISETTRTAAHTHSNSDLITVSRGQLQEMIDEGISRFFKQVYDKTVTEETIRKTINLLIKEGRIQPKKKQI